MGVTESNVWLRSYKEKRLQYDFIILVSYIEHLTVDCSSRSLLVHTCHCMIRDIYKL